MVTFQKQQTDFPESPEGVARNTHVALSCEGTVMLSVGTDRRVRVYRRDKIADSFGHSANFDGQVGKGFITDVSITDNGELGLIGDESGRLVTFTTQAPLISTVIETDVEYGRVISCSISLNYVLASFYDADKKRSRMILLRREHQTLADEFSIVKIWKHNNIGNNYDQIFQCCTVRNNLRNGRIAASIAYWTNRKLFYANRIRRAPDNEVISQAFIRPPVSCRIVMVELGQTFLCVARDDGTLMRFDPSGNAPVSRHNTWNVDGVTFNQSLCMSALILDNGNLRAALAIINTDQKLETYEST